MRRWLESWVNGIWYRSKPPPFWLRWLVPIYRWGFQRNQNKPVATLNTPVIVVGNITAGGTGKTPVVIALAGWLKDAGYRTGVVSRGYGRSGDQPQRVTAESKPEAVGDEALLIASVTGVPLVVGQDRVQAARLLEDEVDIVLSDDGLQHRALPRVIEICIVDTERGLGNGYLLPAGPLREARDRLQTVDYVLGRGDRQIKDIALSARFSLAGEKVLPLSGRGEPELLASWQGREVHAVAGIANPERFFSDLEAAGLDVVRHPFPDHHRYVASDLSSCANAPILMTAKDAVKCTHLGLSNAWYRPVNAEFTEEFKAEFMERVSELTEQPK